MAEEQGRGEVDSKPLASSSTYFSPKGPPPGQETQETPVTFSLDRRTMGCYRVRLEEYFRGREPGEIFFPKGGDDFLVMIGHNLLARSGRSERVW